MRVTVYSLTAFLFTAIPAVSSAEIACYQGGRLTGLDCASHITRFCTALESLGIAAGNAASICFGGSGNICTFTAWHAASVANDNGNFTAANCESVLENVNTNCPMGGTGRNAVGGRFAWTMDPFPGTCGNSAVPTT